MGVLNVTPDSFSDGGHYLAVDTALRRAEKMLADGATIIDVGGESTRPGAEAVTAREEIDRVEPVLRELLAAGVMVSLDSSKAAVIERGLELGVHLINDVRALREPGALAAAARGDAAICLMHMQGEPRTMQQSPAYVDVVAEIQAFLAERLTACQEHGVAPERLLIDPGFGFGKTLQHNLELLRRLVELTRLGPPLLVGLSRKSMLQSLTGRPVHERLAGSLALAIAAVEGGARIIRAHDVAETVDALKVWQAFRAPE